MSEQSVAALVARGLAGRGVERVYGLCGGHVMPLWMRLDGEHVPIVDVRDERSAVFMAHAHAEVTGRLGVALVTAGPGVTNAVTGIANAHAARAPVLVLSGSPPRAQAGRGALQDLPHAELVRPVTRLARSVSEPAEAAAALEEAVARAFGSGGGDPGPVYLDFPVDTLRAPVPAATRRASAAAPSPPEDREPDARAVTRAVELLWAARRPLVITGRGARGAAVELLALLDRTGALYLDTGESRGLVGEGHPSVVTAVRGMAMAEADLVVTIGRKLDFQLGYGSPAVFPHARFLRIADAPGELADNRRGDVELFSPPARALRAMLDAAAREVAGPTACEVAEPTVRRTPALDRAWAERLRREHALRSARLLETMRSAKPGQDGLMHPYRLLAALRDALPRDTIVAADGGDILSFARIGLPAATYLDPGPLGCLGVGTPFGIAASLAAPGRTVAVVTGDGSLGFSAMELDTAARHRAPVLVVVANNGAWGIEVRDQAETHGHVVGTRLAFADYAALARALGLHAERVERAEDLPAAIGRALDRRPALLDVLVTPEAASPDSRAGLAWVPDLQPLAAWDDAERKLGER